MTSATRPLRGQVVVVTRPVDPADRLPELLRAAGATVHAFPLLHFEPPTSAQLATLGTALARLSTSAGSTVILSSPRAVAAVAARIPRDVPVYAVGSRTRSDAVAAGLSVRHDREVPDGAALAQLIMQEMDVKGRSFLVPTSNVADPSVATALRAGGAEVDVVVAYRTVQAEALPEPMVMLLRSGVSAVVLGSPSAVEVYARGTPTRDGPALVVPGRSSEAACRQHGLARVFTAEHPDVESWVQVVVRACSPA